MHNFLEDPVPEDPIQRIREFARDLAYGAAVELWSSRLQMVRTSQNKWIWREATGEILTALNNKWEGRLPSPSLLVSFEYAYEYEGKSSYLLTSKAFALLESSLARVFISYRRSQSALLALLILARLKAIGINPFFDIQDIGPGDKFSEHIRKQIAESDHLICLIGPNTLTSDWVRKEIRWGIDANCQIIPVWHDGFTASPHLEEAVKLYPELNALGEANPIEIKGSSVEDYNNAMVTLVNYFGVTPT